MSRKLKRYAVLVLLMLVLIQPWLPQATAEVESRREIRAGNVLYNSDTSVIAILRALYHRDTLASTDTESFAISPISTPGNGISLAQTSADTAVATQTGFTATLRYAWIPYEIGDKIGDSPEWAMSLAPVSFAGIPADSMLIFPQMSMIKHMTGGANNTFSYIIDSNASIPAYPGNMMLVKKAADDQGLNALVLERPPGDYWTPFATHQDIANKTIMQRMWANSHIIYKMDKAYTGETCFPKLICPYKDISGLFPQVPDRDIINSSLRLTHTGMHMRKIFWPAG